MALFRALSNLTVGEGMIERGGVFPEWAVGGAKVERLRQLGRVERVNAPPLEALPGWKGRAKLLNPLGIRTVEDLMAGDEDEIGAAVRRSRETVEGWKREALAWLEAPEMDGPSGLKKR